jgi:hypothetical protein
MFEKGIKTYNSIIEWECAKGLYIMTFGTRALTRTNIYHDDPFII